MNIFATFECPIQSAKYLDDKRVVKMVLESAQLLSTAIIQCNGYAVYKPTHIKHPCSLWTKASMANYEWLLEHFQALSNEYTFRYDKKHQSYTYFKDFFENKKLFPKIGLQKFANCTRNKEQNIDFRDIDDVHLAYRLYLHERWKHDKRNPTCRIKY